MTNTMSEDIAHVELSELLESTHYAVEGMASPDSGVSSGSDSDPFSPTDLPTPRSAWASLTGEETGDHFTTLSKADLTPCAEFQRPSMQPSSTSGSFVHGDVWRHCPEEYFLSSSETLQHPACASEPLGASNSAVFWDNGEWAKTNVGFQIRHMGDGKAQVKLVEDLPPYDIDTNVDILDLIPPDIKTEFNPYNASEYCSDINSNNNPYTCMNINDINNNSSVDMNSTILSYHDEGCGNCLQNRSLNYGVSHCPQFQEVSHPHSDHNDHTVHRPCRASRRPLVTRTERLWEFILRLLGDPKHNPRLIEWVERDDGTFRLNNSKAIAHMWGMRKNNGQMTYEKLSRALRYYYHRQILEPVLGKKLVYRFGPNALQVWENRNYRPQGAR